MYFIIKYIDHILKCYYNSDKYLIARNHGWFCSWIFINQIASFMTSAHISHFSELLFLEFGQSEESNTGRGEGPGCLNAVLTQIMLCLAEAVLRNGRYFCMNPYWISTRKVWSPLLNYRGNLYLIQAYHQYGVCSRPACKI